jgi:hypothetical protein
MSHREMSHTDSGIYGTVEERWVSCPFSAIRGRLKERKVKEGNVKGISLSLTDVHTAAKRMKEERGGECNEAAYL